MIYPGEILASAILLPLATEIALKAWQCRERKGAPDRSHDLLKLFEGLSEDAQAQLEEGLPVWLDPWSIRLGVHEVCPVGAGMRKVLEYHRQSFEHWRYLYESSIGSLYAPALNEALTVIIETLTEIMRDQPDIIGHYCHWDALAGNTKPLTEKCRVGFLRKPDEGMLTSPVFSCTNRLWHGRKNTLESIQQACHILIVNAGHVICAHVK